MALLGSHVLLVTHDFPEEDDDAFNEWYIREHMPERVLGLPGFCRGRRYRSIGDGPKYLAFYEADAHAFSSDAYLKLVRDFDPRSRTFVSRFQSPSRTISAVRGPVGPGEGGVLGLIGFASRSSDRLRGEDAGTLLNDLVGRRGVASAHLIEADIDALEHSRKGHLRQNDLVLPFTLMVECIDDRALSAVWAERLSHEALLRAGAEKALVRGRYRLLFGLTAPSRFKTSE